MSEITNAQLAESIENLARATMNGFTELRTEMRDMKTELHEDMSQMKSELRGEMRDMKTELHEDMSQMKSELLGEMKSMKEEIIEVVVRKDEQNKEDIRHLYSITDQLRKDVETIRVKVGVTA